MKHYANLLSATNEEIIKMIDNCINGRNAERDRKVLKRRLIDGITFERLSEEFELSTNAVKTIVYTREIDLLKCINK